MKNYTTFQKSYAFRYFYKKSNFRNYYIVIFVYLVNTQFDWIQPSLTFGEFTIQQLREFEHKKLCSSDITFKFYVRFI